MPFGSLSVGLCTRWPHRAAHLRVMPAVSQPQLHNGCVRLVRTGAAPSWLFAFSHLVLAIPQAASGGRRRMLSGGHCAGRARVGQSSGLQHADHGNPVCRIISMAPPSPHQTARKPDACERSVIKPLTPGDGEPCKDRQGREEPPRPASARSWSGYGKSGTRCSSRRA